MRQMTKEEVDSGIVGKKEDGGKAKDDGSLAEGKDMASAIPARNPPEAPSAMGIFFVFPKKKMLWTRYYF